MIDTIRKMDCTGCKMCKDICPKDAITYVTDKEGFWYPKVDSNKCVCCKRCISACPSLTDHRNSEAAEPIVYASWALSDDTRRKSTSGGIFYVLAQEMLKRQGFIAACKYTDDFKAAYHTVGNTITDLEQFRGSKYFQSDTEGIYKKVGELLGRSKKVLFCGAPCQVAGLNHYVGTDNPDLITLDFICRGINSPLVFRKYVEDCEAKYQSPVSRVHLKNKNKGWTRLGTYMEFRNGKKYYRDRVTDPWVNGYVRGNLFMRPCCSECKYKERNRVADISIGDFWGLQSTYENIFKGISVVLVNTQKGDRYFDSVKDMIYTEKRTYEEATKGNGCMLKSAPMGMHREEFFEQLGNFRFEKLVWKLLNESRMKIFLKELWYNLSCIKNGR